jgi:hypothetical protein
MSMTLALVLLAAAGQPERLAVHPPLTPSLSKKEKQRLSGLEGEVLNLLARQARWVLVDESDVAAALAPSGGSCPALAGKLNGCLVALAALVRASASLVVEVTATDPGRFIVAVTLVKQAGGLERADERVEVPSGAVLLEALLPAIKRVLAQVTEPVAAPSSVDPLAPRVEPEVSQPPLPPPPMPLPEAPRRPLVGPAVSVASAALGAVAFGLGLDNAERARGLISRLGMPPPPSPYALASPADVGTLQRLDAQSVTTVGFSIGAAVVLAAGLVLWLAGW